VIQAKKSLGQHFLSDTNMARKIVAAASPSPEATVVEIGPGTGALTELLLDPYPDLIAVEIDQRAVEYLRERFPELDVREENVLEIDWEMLSRQVGGPLYVIGNLPYNITSPILFSLTAGMPAVERCLVMMQLEVAERIVAGPGNKRYGILSVMMQLAGDPELLFKVPPQVFVPPPNVTSAVLELTARPHPALTEASVNLEAVRRVVRTAFNQRRKMLRNSLGSITSARGREVPEDWERKRAERLSPAEFVQLTEHLYQK
jgi:16S rRNA (adenine1518-N6/adenine1519-N6)-dimethyltransferase